MSQRDWQKDWEMCEKATPGKWICIKVRPVSHTSEFYEVRAGIAVVLDSGQKCYINTICSTSNRHDAEFIAEAREALPCWLQRVRELEDEVKYLKAMLDCYVAVLEAAGITANDANIVGKHLKEMGVKHEEI